jgi:uncharacterized protein YndB with AHSA1/START domain
VTSPHGQLDIDKLVDASQDSVWDAWTTEAGLARWWWSGWSDTVYTVDLRVGGRYHIEAPDAGVAVHGEYVVVDAPNRLEMTWVWVDDDGEGPLERVRVEFTNEDGRTRIRVRHVGPWTTPEPSENYRQGWEHVLAQLAAMPAG